MLARDGDLGEPGMQIIGNYRVNYDREFGAFAEQTSFKRQPASFQLVKHEETMMKYLKLLTGMLILLCLHKTALAQAYRRLPVGEYVDKMKAGWIGQMAGVGWGAPTEFIYKGVIIPEEKMPEWDPSLINQFKQDDIYVEMAFLQSLEKYGIDVSTRQAGIDFAMAEYGLAHANKVGRNNLRLGIAPPDSGHPAFNRHADCIDYQIQADFSGLISPGLPQRVIKLGEQFGRIVNYGDGLYGGLFVGAMYSEAFFETDIKKIIKAGLAAIPEGSQYHECITDVIKWHGENPDDWEKTWRLIDKKYHLNHKYRRFTCWHRTGALRDAHQRETMLDPKNIEAKLNGAYIVMGMLYGQGDIDKTIIISTRCGQDSDCNPSSGAGVLFTALGFKNLPERFVSALDPKGKFSNTPYDFPKVIEVCEMLARKIVVAEGGRIEKDDKGKEFFVIPMQTPDPGKLEQSWEPGPVANSTFTDAEMALMKYDVKKHRWRIGERFPMKAGVEAFQKAVERFAPGWDAASCARELHAHLRGVGTSSDFCQCGAEHSKGGDVAGLRDKWGGRDKVLVSYPLREFVPCVLRKNVDVPAGRKTTLRLGVGHDSRGGWTLVVKANGKVLVEKKIAKDTCRDGWTTVIVDLSDYAGKSVDLELLNRANNWSCEAGYWSRIDIQSE